jgi:DNA primase large subunit
MRLLATATGNRRNRRTKATAARPNSETVQYEIRPNYRKKTERQPHTTPSCRVLQAAS